MRVAIWGGGEEELAPLLAQFGREYGLEVEPEPLDEGLGPAAAGLYQVALLNADRPGCMELGRRLRLRAPHCPILLFACDRRAALSGYAVHPSAFLLRPVGYRALRAGLEQCRSCWQQEARRVSLPVGRTQLQVLWADILWVEVQGRRLTVHGCRGSVDSRMSMARMAALLEGGPFMLCHRSTLVNLFRVWDWAGEALVLDNGGQLPVSGERLDSVRARLARLRAENIPWAAERFGREGGFRNKKGDFTT